MEIRKTPKIKMNTDELTQENRHLKDQLASLSKTHAKDRQRLDELLSDYIRDKRIIGEALGLTGEDAMIHSFQLRAIHFLHNS
jgi:septal ring factor EnvC (AmiA/AmiB activator)